MPHYHFKLSKATIKTFARFYDIVYVGRDVVSIFEQSIIDYVVKIIDAAIAFARARTGGLSVKRLYLEDIEKGIKKATKHAPPTLDEKSVVSSELALLVLETGMRPSSKLLLHRFPLHNLVYDICKSRGEQSIQIGNNTLTLLQNEIEIMIFKLVKDCAKKMKQMHVSTLSVKVVTLVSK